MNSEKINLLSTRLLDKNIKIKAADKNIFIDEIELIQIKLICNKQLAKTISEYNFPAIFTSIHAVEAVMENISLYQSHHKINESFCISGRTKIAVENAKIKIIESASSASELSKKIIQSKTKELVYFCGNKRRDELPDALKNANILVHEIAIYETQFKSKKIELNQYEGILFFSPSAVESYFLNNTFSKKVVSFCIGKTTADEVFNKQPDSKIIISSEPSEESLLNSIYKFYNRK